jgi:dipeptidyl aminopeptidase/acylaminoacyl peptidase
MITRRFLMGAALAAPAVARAQAVAAAPVPPTIDELLAEAELLDAALSPDGKQLAILRQGWEGGKRRAYVVLARADDTSVKAATIGLGDKQVDQVEWGKNDRLLVWVTYADDSHGVPYGFVYDDLFIATPLRRVVSVGLNGDDPVVLFGQNRSVYTHDYDIADVVDFMPDDPRQVMMKVWDDGHRAYALHHVDIYTGASTPVEYGNSDTDSWFTQNGVPFLRVDTNSRGTVARIYGRAPTDTDWKLVRKVRMDEFKKMPDFDFVGGTAQAGVFLVATRAEGADLRSIRTFDLRTLQFGDQVAAVPGREVSGVIMDAAHQLVATTYFDDRLAYNFADAKIAPHFKGVNKFFANEANVGIYELDQAHDRFVLHVSGPRDPGSFWIYHRDQARLESLGSCQPKLTAERLATMEALRVKTRDGFEISAYLTRPIGAAKGPLPMVVMPHGGPELRDSLDWDVFAQTLAARGWLVLQPNFRGSGGYGRAYAESGRKHWGDVMQADVEDAVAQVVASGVADPRRLAICGASYGGYAALMGAVRKPDLYKAVVSIAGDCELIETLAFSKREDGADSAAYAYWLASIGDPKVDEAMLIAASPGRHAAEIKAPVLLMHGTRDKIVDPNQSKIMAKALKAAGKPYQYVELKGEGHRGWSTDAWKTVLTTSADFIGTHI